MKTLRLLFILVTVIAVSATFQSCKKSEDGGSSAPTITVTIPATASIQVDRYQDVVFKFSCAYNSNSKEPLTKVAIELAFSTGGTEKILDSTININTININHTYTILPTAPWGQVITATLSVTDKAGQTAQKKFTMTVTNSSDILEGIDLIMGAQSAAEGSYFTSDSCKVWLSTIAKANQGKVDFIYFNDEAGGNGDCIGAPNEPSIANQSVNLVGSFTTKNATLFKPIVPIEDSVWNKIRTNAKITDYFENNPDAAKSVVKTLTDGTGGTSPTYIAFKTIGPYFKHGLIRVKFIDLGATGPKNKITIDVKVAK